MHQNITMSLHTLLHTAGTLKSPHLRMHKGAACLLQRYHMRNLAHCGLQ